MSLEIDIDSAGGATRVSLTGELDMESVASFRDTVAAALRDGRPAMVTVDLTGLTFLDSTGIAGLIRGRHLADAYTTKYQVVNPRSGVRWVLEVAGVLPFLCGTAAVPDRR